MRHTPTRNYHTQPVPSLQFTPAPTPMATETLPAIACIKSTDLVLSSSVFGASDSNSFPHSMLFRPAHSLTTRIFS